MSTSGVHLQDDGRKALRVFFRIAAAWGLTDAEQMILLGIDEPTFLDWKAGKLRCGPDHATLERLSHVFGIYSTLQRLFPIPERANAWVRRPNTAPLFGGTTALHRMLRGQVADLFAVRQYLEAQASPAD